MAALFRGLRTAADLCFEPDDGLRRELHDGVVHTHPPTSDEHSWAALAAYRALTRDEPADVYVLHNLGVHVGPRRLYAPDLLVVQRTALFHDYGYDPAGVLLVLEVVAPAPSRRREDPRRLGDEPVHLRGPVRHHHHVGVEQRDPFRADRVGCRPAAPAPRRRPSAAPGRPRRCPPRSRASPAG